MCNKSFKQIVLNIAVSIPKTTYILTCPKHQPKVNLELDLGCAQNMIFETSKMLENFHKGALQIDLSRISVSFCRAILVHGTNRCNYAINDGFKRIHV